MCATKTICDGGARVFPHTCASDEVSVTRLFYDFLSTCGIENLCCLLNTELGNLLVVVMEPECDFCDTQSKMVGLISQLNSIIFPGKNLTEDTESCPVVVIHHHTA